MSEELGERVAKLEAVGELVREKVDRAHARLDMQAQDVISTASAMGAESAKSYLKGLDESFIKDTNDKIRRLELSLVALWVTVATVTGVLGLRVWLVGGLLP